jgi:hypothetical protein
MSLPRGFLNIHVFEKNKSLKRGLGYWGKEQRSSGQDTLINTGLFIVRVLVKAGWNVFVNWGFLDGRRRS